MMTWSLAAAPHWLNSLILTVGVIAIKGIVVSTHSLNTQGCKLTTDTEIHNKLASHHSPPSVP